MALKFENSEDTKRNWIRLSGRETEILGLIAQGRKSKEVAESLFISKRTVEYHLANVYFKLGAANRIQAILAASRMGLIPINPLQEGGRDHQAGIERELISSCPEQPIASFDLGGSYTAQNMGAGRQT